MPTNVTRTQFFRVFTRLPRLTALVRRLKGSPSNEDVAAKVVQLADDLLRFVWHVSHG